MKEKEHPRWDLTNIYPNLDSAEFKNDQQKLGQMLSDLHRFVEEHNIKPDGSHMQRTRRGIRLSIG